MQRQSLPNAPITDRKNELDQQRDSMAGARQGLQGAAVNRAGNSAFAQDFKSGSRYPVARPTKHTVITTNSITNDRLSSVQFVLSQSDRDGTVQTSMSNANNYINVADGTVEHLDVAA